MKNTHALIPTVLLGLIASVARGAPLHIIVARGDGLQNIVTVAGGPEAARALPLLGAKDRRVTTDKPKTVAHAELFTTPRLVAFVDSDPCGSPAAKAPTGSVIAHDVERRAGSTMQVTVASLDLALPIGKLLAIADNSDVLVTFLTPKGPVEPKGRPAVRVPAGMDLPLFLAREFSSFYGAMFLATEGRDGRATPMMEFSGPASSCGPCVVNPLSREELKELGATWITEESTTPQLAGNPFFDKGDAPAKAFLTRLHFHGKGEVDPMHFEEKAGAAPFAASYVLHRPLFGDPKCSEGKKWYGEELRRRTDRQAHTVATLTGWPVADMYKRMGVRPSPPPKENESGEPQDGTEKKWYQKLFD